MQWIWKNEESTRIRHNHISNPGFAEWMQNEVQIFWIYGKPGAGKSTLMKQLIESKQMVDHMPRKPGPVITVSYFFHEFSQPQEKLFRSLLQAMLHELVLSFQKTDPRALSIIMKTLEPQVGRRSRDQQRSISEVEKLKEALFEALAVCQNAARLWLFVDGMDECEGDRREHLDFLKTWIESSTKSKLSVKACIASRDEPDIRLRLFTCLSLAIHHFTRENISAYVTRRLKAAGNLMLDQPHYTTTRFDQSLIDMIVEKADGVFLWVNLVVTQLIISIEEDSEARELRRQLNDMPDGLRDLYSRIVAKIPQKFSHDAINFLRIYDHSIYLPRTPPVRPHALTLWQFCAAAEEPSTAIRGKAYFEYGFREESLDRRRGRCEEMKRRIRRSCKGLIHVDEAEDVQKAEVTLSHRTVKEFIIRDDSFRVLMGRANQRLIRDPETSLMAMSLRLLKVDKTYEPKWFGYASADDREEFTSYEEATEKWTSVFQDDDSDIVYFFLFAAAAAARRTGDSHKRYVDELDRALSFLRPEWAGLYYSTLQEDGRADWNMDVLSLAVVHNMDVYVEEEFKTHGSELCHRVGRPLLCYVFDGSTGYRHPATEIIDMLLSNGANPNERFHDITPWTWAVRNRMRGDRLGKGEFPPWIQRLLEFGADPTEQVFPSRNESYSSRVPVTLTYTTTFHIVLCFLDDVDVGKQLEIIRLLLGNCNDLDLADSDGTTISTWADKADKRVGRLLREEIAAIRARN